MINDFRLYCPISKVNEEKRTVAGWATTENLDKQNEVVDYAGSKEAFSSWAKNVREMHEPKAVGKAVEIIPNDAEKKIWVETYISKGAEDTWQKVKEGILTGFSIGGQTVNKVVQIIKDMNTGGNRTVSRITKYKLNELSLVDNPANPECSFSLVKSIDGIPFQTEIVEDNTKIMITEGEDPLKKEVSEHRDKADSLIKKVLEKEELEKLGDDNFGVIRKYVQDGAITKERLIPMPDKVHAVRALKIMDNYNLSIEEKELIHKKAQGILGAAYDTYTDRGGNEKVSNEAIDKLTEIVSTLVKKVESLEKAYEGAHRPISGAKATPKDAETTPALGESAPAEAGAADGVNTEKAMAGATTGNITDAPEVTPSAPAEAGAADDVNTEPGAPKVAEEPKAAEAAIKPTAPEQSGAADDVKTDGPIKMEAVKEDEECPLEEAKEKAEEETEDEKKKKATKKIADNSENDLSKIVSAMETLSKRVDDVNKRLEQPKPRKFKVEKNLDDSTSEGDELRKLTDDFKKLNESGKALTPEQLKLKDQLVNKMLDAKFGKSL